MNDDIIIINDPEIDVNKIMDQIKTNISKRKYTEDDISMINRLEEEFESSLISDQRFDTNEINSIFISPVTFPEYKNPKLFWVKGPNKLFINILLKIFRKAYEYLSTNKNRAFTLLLQHINELSNTNQNIKNKLEESSIKHEESSIKHEELSIKHEELSIKHEELSIKHEELSIKHEELSNEHKLSEKNQNKELHYKSQEINLIRYKFDEIYSRMIKENINKEDLSKFLIKTYNTNLDHYYYLFEEKHRGSREEIKDRFSKYLPYVNSSSLIIDIGCGRGEFIEILEEKKIKAMGIDSNEDMVYYCQKDLGLDVRQGDGIDFLRNSDDNAFSTIICMQVIEHFGWDQIIEFLKMSFQKLKTNGKLIIETVNIKNIIISAINFYYDITHKTHIHPDSLHDLIIRLGFSNAEIIFSSEFPDEFKFKLFEDNEILNENFRKLNDLLFTYQDYAIIAEK